jgi:hypothetical protein
VSDSGLSGIAAVQGGIAAVQVRTFSYATLSFKFVFLLFHDAQSASLNTAINKS